VFLINQCGHEPGILGDFPEHGKLRQFCATSGKNCNKQSSFSLSFKYLQIFWIFSTCVLGFKWTKSREFLIRSECGDELLYCWSWCGMTLDEGHYYIYFLLRRKSKCMALESAGNFFSYFVATLLMHWPVGVQADILIGNHVFQIWRHLHCVYFRSPCLL